MSSSPCPKAVEASITRLTGSVRKTLVGLVSSSNGSCRPIPKRPA
jgi:hypothetical protein